MKTKQTTSVNSPICLTPQEPERTRTTIPFQTSSARRSNQISPSTAPPRAPKSRRRRAETPTETPGSHRHIFRLRIYPIHTPKPTSRDASHPRDHPLARNYSDPTARGFTPRNSQRSVPRSTDDAHKSRSSVARSTSARRNPTRGIIHRHLTRRFEPRTRRSRRQPPKVNINRVVNPTPRARNSFDRENQNSPVDPSPRSTSTRPRTRCKPIRKKVNDTETHARVHRRHRVVVVVATHHLHKQQVLECRAARPRVRARVDARFSPCFTIDSVTYITIRSHAPILIFFDKYPRVIDSAFFPIHEVCNTNISHVNRYTSMVCTNQTFDGVPHKNFKCSPRAFEFASFDSCRGRWFECVI